MTQRPASPGTPTKRDKFPVFSPRDDMQNPIHLHDPGHQAVLRRHFGNPGTTIVLGEVPVGWNPRQRRGVRIPDLLIAFNIDRPQVIEQQGFSIEELGKPPDFVLEIASPTTGRSDYTVKREDYARFGIPEYWRFDASGGRYYDTALAGDRLIEGAYRPVEIVQLEGRHLHGSSAVLGLELCWQEGRLRWYDPAEQRYLPTIDEMDDERIAEQQARLVAEERIRELEAENRRLRG